MLEKTSSRYRANTFEISEIHWERFWKITLTCLFLLISAALIVVWNTPATGYESSIYQSTPLILWVSIVASFIVGVILVATSIAKNGLNYSYLWKMGILLILLSYVICLSLFVIRGYYAWHINSDPGYHIRYIKETLNTGYAPTSIIYPITHIYLSEISFFTGLDLIILHQLVPVIFGLFCVLFMYVLAKSLFPSRNGALLVAVISCCLTFDWYLDLTPNALSNLFFPFALFLIIKFFQKRERTWAIALSIVIYCYPVFHILPAIILGLILFTLGIPNILSEMIQNLREREVHVLKYSSSNLRLVYPLLLLLIWIIFWISSFQVFGYTVWDIYQKVALEGGETKGMAFLDQIVYAQNYGYSVIEQALKEYSAVLLLFSLSLLALPLLWRDFTTKGQSKFLFSFYGSYFAILIVMGALFVFNLPFGPFRLMIYISMLGTLFAAYLLTYFLTDRKTKRIPLLQTTYFKVMCATVVITFLFFTSMLTLYPSPYNLGANHQTTQSEVMGMTFCYYHRNVNTPVTVLTFSLEGFTNAFLNPEEQASHCFPPPTDKDQRIPWHFGYDRYFTLSSVYSSETYMCITQKDKLQYVDLFPEIARLRFTDMDFERLDHDPSVDFLYSNGGFDLRKVATVV